MTERTDGRTQRQKDRYEDLLLRKRPVSKLYRPMSLENRAAQFAPFSALTSHGEAIQRTAERAIERVEANFRKFL